MNAAIISSFRAGCSAGMDKISNSISIMEVPDVDLIFNDEPGANRPSGAKHGGSNLASAPRRISR